MRKASFFLIAGGIIPFVSCASIKTAQPRAKPTILSQHIYRPGESFDYYFEDTDAQYSTDVGTDFPRAKEVHNTQELKIWLRIDILAVEGSTVTKRVELEDVLYRSLNKDQIAGGKSADVPYRPIPELIPGFPARFSYTYTDEGQVVIDLSRFFIPYRKSDVGNFLYYKLLDVHTFQATINRLPAEPLGQFSIRSSRDIPLKQGSFHNHQPLRHFQRIDTLDGVSQAYYKVMTLGNYYDVPSQEIDTNYQYAFYAPLEGPFAGLLYQGELQETVFTHNPDESAAIIARQLSMHLQTAAHRSPPRPLPLDAH